MRHPARKKAFATVLICFLIAGLSWLCALTIGNAYARSVYAFQNEEGFFVIPTNVEVFTPTSPGPWGSLIEEHTPRLDIRPRHEGLEDKTLIEAIVPHPMQPVPDSSLVEEYAAFDEPRLREIYCVDKDGVILGYYKFESSESFAHLKMIINGIINYFEFYVVCTHHGVWKFKYHLKTF